MAKEEKHKKDNPGGLFIPTGVFLGLAYGFYTGNLPGGFFAGLGLGFLLFALVSLLKKN